MYRFLILFSMFLVMAGVYLFLGLQHPRRWAGIRRGCSREQVKAICPTLEQGLGEVKGDFCEGGLPLMRWSLQVAYDASDNVQTAHLVLFLGTKNLFKRIH